MKNSLSILVFVVTSGCGVQTEESPLNPNEQHSHDDHDASTQSRTSGEDIVDAPDAAQFTAFKFGTGALKVAPAADLSWDLAIARTMLRTNGGTSGPGVGGAVLTEFRELDAAVVCPTDGYQADASLPVPGPPGSGEFSGNAVLNAWYDYDPQSHAVATKGQVYCVRTADGKYAALSIKNYTSGKMTLRWRFQPNGNPEL